MCERRRGPIPGPRSQLRACGRDTPWKYPPAPPDEDPSELQVTAPRSPGPLSRVPAPREAGGHFSLFPLVCKGQLFPLSLNRWHFFHNFPVMSGPVGNWSLKDKRLLFLLSAGSTPAKISFCVALQHGRQITHSLLFATHLAVVPTYLQGRASLSPP